MIYKSVQIGFGMLLLVSGLCAQITGGGGAAPTANDVKNAVYCPDTGSANAIACTTTTAFPGAYAAGQTLNVKIAATNSGATTINVNSLGAKAVTTQSLATLSSGALVSGGQYLLGYDGTEWQVLGGSAGTQQVAYCAPASASGTAYTCSPSPALTTYAGTVVHFIPDVNGTGGATTINVSALGAKSIKWPDGSTNPISSDFVAKGFYTLVYDGAAFRILPEFYPTTVTAEQCGAKGDNSTDDTTAIQACINFLQTAGGGTVKFRAATYKITANLLITGSYVSLRGEGPRISILNSTDTTHDLLSITGTGANCSAGLVAFNEIHGIGVRRTSQASAGNGISITNGCWVDLRDVESWDSISDFYQRGTADASYFRTQAYWQNSSGTARVGYEIDSASGGANNTVRMRHTVVADNGTNVTGFNMHGSCVADFSSYDFQTAGTGTGIAITSTFGAGTSFNLCNGDIHFTGIIIDSAATVGIVITNVNGGGVPNIDIDSAYIDGGGNGIDIESSQGVKFSGSEIRSRGGSSTAIILNGSANNIIQGNKIDITPTGISIQGASNSNSIVGNTLSATPSNVATTHISVTGNSLNNVIVGNTLNGNATTGISIGAGSNNNKIGLNTIDTTNITTTVSDSGTGTVYDTATLQTGTTFTLVGNNGFAVCTGTCTVTVPVPTVGAKFCIMNDDNVATVITLAALGASARYENTARTAYGTAGTGTFVSTAAAGSAVCLVGRDSTHYITQSFTGTWTAN